MNPTGIHASDIFRSVEDDAGCPVCGSDSCEIHGGADTGTRMLRLEPQRALDVISWPAPAAIVEGVAWSGCLTILVSESGTGKTFVVLSMGAAVADGVPWLGREALEGSVLYVGFEGDALPRRLAGLRRKGHRLEHLYIIRASDPISPYITRDGETPSSGERDLADAILALRERLAAANLPPIVLLIIDTVRASLAGSEDSSEHASAYLRAVRRLLALLPDAAAILTHHAGWQDGEDRRKRERGSSAWRGNCDATLYLAAGAYDPERGEAELTLEARKTRDDELPRPLHLVRRRIHLLELDRNGEPVTTCVIDTDRRTRQDREAQQAEHEEVEARAIDHRVLRIVADQPDLATSQDRIRVALGIRRDLVITAVARLLQREWISPPQRQRQPYTLTAAGRQALQDGATP